MEELKQITDPIQDRLLDFSLSVEENKLALKNNIKGKISKSKHPSVWHSIKLIESKVNEKWKRIFEDIPEALHW